METDQLLADRELDYGEDGELSEDGETGDSMEEGELQDSDGGSLETAAAGQQSRQADRATPPPLSQQARRKRAERFGLDPHRDPSPDPDPDPDPVDREQRRRVYASLNLVEPDGGPVYWRGEALHVRGTDRMTSQDVLAYFRQFRPVHVEWIGDGACNVVWSNDREPLRALLALSSPIVDRTGGAAGARNSAAEPDPDALVVGLDDMDTDSLALAEDSEMKNPDDEEAVDVSDIKIDLPPGKWRLGVPHPKAENLLVRFATRGDKKIPGAERHSNYYKLYGDPSQPRVTGILTERRRRLLRGQPDEPADPAPVLSHKANPWSGIAATWATAEASRRQMRDYDHDAELALLRHGGPPRPTCAPDWPRGRPRRCPANATTAAAPTPTRRTSTGGSNSNDRACACMPMTSATGHRRGSVR